MTIRRFIAPAALALATLATGCAPGAAVDGVSATQFELTGLDGQASQIEVLACGADRYATRIDGAARTLHVDMVDGVRIFTVDGPDGELLFGEQAADGTTRLAGPDGRQFVAAGALPLDMVRGDFDDATLLMLDAQLLDTLGDVCAAPADGLAEHEQALRFNGAIRPTLQWGENCPGATCAADDDTARCCCDVGQRCVSWGGGCDCEATDANDKFTIGQTQTAF